MVDHEYVALRFTSNILHMHLQYIAIALQFTSLAEGTRLARARAINAPVFKTGPFLFRRTLPIKSRRSVFALAILPSLLKPAIHAVAHVFIGFEPTFIHYQ